MDSLKTTEIKDSVGFLRLKDLYKGDLLDDSRLNKAAELAAQQHLLLTSKAPDGWKEPRLKAVGRELQQWTKRVRQFGRPTVSGDGGGDAEDELNLAAGPMHTIISKLMPKKKTIKPTDSTPVQTDIPVKAPKKKKRVSLAVTPKGTKKSVKKKRLYFRPPEEILTPPEPLSKRKRTASPIAHPLPYSGTFSAVSDRIAKRKKQQRAIQTLKAAPGWKPFGTPVKRGLDGQDY